MALSISTRSPSRNAGVSTVCRDADRRRRSPKRRPRCSRPSVDNVPDHADLARRTRTPTSTTPTGSRRPSPSSSSRPGRIVKGHKIGLTSKAMRSLTGATEPDYGTMFDDWFVLEGSAHRPQPHEPAARRGGAGLRAPRAARRARRERRRRDPGHRLRAAVHRDRRHPPEGPRARRRWSTASPTPPPAASWSSAAARPGSPTSTSAASAPPCRSTAASRRAAWPRR